MPTGVGDVLGERFPLRAVGLVGVREGDRVVAQVLVGCGPGDGEVAGVSAAADVDVGQLHQRFGLIDFDPELRRVAYLRGAFAQADAATNHQRQAVQAFAADLQYVRRLGVGGVFTVFLPAAAILRVPQLDRGDTGRPLVVHFEVEADAAAVNPADVGGRGGGTAEQGAAASPKAADAVGGHGGFRFALVAGAVDGGHANVDRAGDACAPVMGAGG